MEREKISIDGHENIKIQTRFASEISLNEPELWFHLAL